MFYSIRHATRFHYSAPVSESNMELRMRPRSEGHQRCLKHEIKITPRVRVSSYRDYLGNTVHFFDVPAPHTKLLVVSEAVVEVDDLPVLPPALPHSAWEEIDALYDGAEHWEMQNPSRFPVFSQKLSALAAELGAERREDPLTLLRELNAALFESFRYLPKSTRVDSPIDEAIHNYDRSRAPIEDSVPLCQRLPVPAHATRRA
jgi:transglutaminase-like putative cysteine protease